MSRGSAPRLGRLLRGQALALVASLLLELGCRLDDTRAAIDGPGGSGHDGGAVDASSEIADAAAAPDAAGDASPDGDGSGAACLAVVTTDFSSTGGVSVIDLESGTGSCDLVSTHPDAVLRAGDGAIFALNRLYGDSLQRLRIADGLSTEWQRSVGNRTNPSDIAIAEDGRAWITLYDTNQLLSVDVRAAREEDFVRRAPIPIDSWSGGDSESEPTAVLLHHDRLLILLQRLDFPDCYDDINSAILSLDPVTLRGAAFGSGRSLLPLSRCNAFSWALDEDGLLWIALAGRFRARGFGEDDGGLEVVDPMQGVSLGLVATEAQLGSRDVVKIVVGDAGRLWLILADDDFHTSVHRLYRAGGELVGQAVWRSEGTFDAVEDGGILWIADRTPGASGVVGLDADSGELLLGPLLRDCPPPFELLPFRAHGGCPGR